MKTLSPYKGRTGYINGGWNFPSGNITVIGEGQMPNSLEVAYTNGIIMEFDKDFIVKNLDQVKST